MTPSPLPQTHQFWIFGDFGAAARTPETFTAQQLDMALLFSELKPTVSFRVSFAGVDDWVFPLSFSCLEQFSIDGLKQLTPQLAFIETLTQGVNDAGKDNPLQLDSLRDQPGFDSLRALAGANADSGAEVIDLLSMVDIGEENDKLKLAQTNDLFNRAAYRGEARTALLKELATIQRETLEQMLKQPEFLRLAGLWRGLAMVSQQAGPQVTFQVVDCDKADHCQATFQLLVREGSDQSADMLIYADSYTLADADRESLHHLGNMADYLGAPVLFDPAPQLFQLKTWSHLTHFKDIAGRLAGPAYIKWRKLRSEEGARRLFPMVNPVRIWDGEVALWAPAAFFTAAIMAQTLNQDQHLDDNLTKAQLEGVSVTAAELAEGQTMALSFEGYSSLGRDESGVVRLQTANALAAITIAPGERLDQSALAEFSLPYQYFAGRLSRMIQQDPMPDKAQLAQMIGATEEDIRVEEDEEQIVFLIRAPFLVYGTRPEVVMGLPLA